MNSLLLYGLLGFAVVMALACVLMYVSKQKLLAEIQGLNDKLLRFEARQSSPLQHEERSTKKAAKPKENPHAKELLELRRDIAHAKEELKRSREDLKQRDADFREREEESSKKLYMLQEENKHLLESVREREQLLAQSRASKPQVTQNTATVEKVERAPSASPEEITRLKQRVFDLERQARAETEKAEAMQSRLTTLQQELRKWREAGTFAEGKTLDPMLFVRWKQRALEGKKMYQLMRRLRELSDEKLATYQQGVEVLAAHIIEEAGVPLPTPRTGEVLSDRYLATAWAILREKKSQGTSIASHSSQETQPLAD